MNFLLSDLGAGSQCISDLTVYLQRKERSVLIAITASKMHWTSVHLHRPVLLKLRISAFENKSVSSGCKYEVSDIRHKDIVPGLRFFMFTAH
jgi:hypothetical protein